MTAETLGKVLNAEEQRVADERRQKGNISFVVSVEERARPLAYTKRHSTLTILSVDHEKALRGRDAEQIITRLCEGI